MRRRAPEGFTLIELMIVVAIISILSVVGILNYTSTARKSEDGVTKGNLAILRSAVGIYFTDHDGSYPTDNLASIAGNAHYLTTIPIAHVLPDHAESRQVITEITPTDTGAWSYNNDRNDAAWGALRVGCLHQDSTGHDWTSF